MLAILFLIPPAVCVLYLSVSFFSPCATLFIRVLFICFLALFDV